MHLWDTKSKHLVSVNDIFTLDSVYYMKSCRFGSVWLWYKEGKWNRKEVKLSSTWHQVLEQQRLGRQLPFISLWKLDYSVIFFFFFCCCFYPIYLYVCVLYPTFFFNSSSFCWSYGSLYYWSSTKKKREKTNKLWNQWSNCSFINAKLLTQFYISFLQIYVDSHILPNSSHSHYVALTGKWIEKSIW